MNRVVFAALSGFAALICLGEMSPEERAKLIRINREVFGGFVVKPDPGNGHITIVNKQTRVSANVISRAVSYIQNFCNLPIVISKRADPTAGLSLYIRDEPGKPELSLYSPEQGWGMINIARLADADTTDERLARRVRQQVARALSWLCGAGGSQYPHTLVAPIGSAKALDSFKDESLPPDVFARMRVYAEALGIRPVRKVPYSTACQEGWAPLPTNKEQRAIWEKVNKIPSEPMKIEFDPKRGK